MLYIQLSRIMPELTRRRVISTYLIKRFVMPVDHASSQ